MNAEHGSFPKLDTPDEISNIGDLNGFPSAAERRQKGRWGHAYDPGHLAWLGRRRAAVAGQHTVQVGSSP